MIEEIKAAMQAFVFGLDGLDPDGDTGRRCLNSHATALATKLKAACADKDQQHAASAAPMQDEDVRKDAERYRWLRLQNWNEAEICCVVNPKNAVRLGYDCPALGRLDVAIDEAMKEKP